MASNKQRGLGRDLEALLGRRPIAENRLGAATSENAAPEFVGKNTEVRQLPVDLLQSGRYQPRQDVPPEALEELAQSIRSQGVIQPIIVRPIGDNKYEIIAGERRWRASQLAGLHDIPAIIKPVDDETASAMALIENVQREDLNPMEEANAYHRLTEEFGLTHQAVADLIGKSRVAVSNILRLINLNTPVKSMLERGALEMGHARALLGLEGHEQNEAAHTVTQKNLSVRETENLVRRIMQKKATSPKTAPSLDPDTRQLQEALSEKLGAQTTLEHQASGKGRLIIRYDSLEQLEGILAHIK